MAAMAMATPASITARNISITSTIPLFPITFIMQVLPGRFYPWEAKLKKATCRRAGLPGPGTNDSFIYSNCGVISGLKWTFGKHLRE